MFTLFLYKNTPHSYRPLGWVYVGVRGMPERDIESLGVMGKGLEAARSFFRRRRRRRRRRRPPKVGV